MQRIAQILHASDASPREIARAALPAILVAASCAIVLGCLHGLHASGLL